MLIPGQEESILQKLLWKMHIDAHTYFAINLINDESFYFLSSLKVELVNQFLSWVFPRTNEIAAVCFGDL